MYPLVNKKYDVNDIDLLILQYGLYIIPLTYIETDFLIEDYSWICGCLFSWISDTYQFQGFVWVNHGRKGCWSGWFLTSCAPPLSKRCVGPMPSRSCQNISSHQDCMCFKNISPCVKTPLGLNRKTENCLGIILQVFSICLFNVYGQLFSTWNIIFNDFFKHSHKIQFDTSRSLAIKYLLCRFVGIGRLTWVSSIVHLFFKGIVFPNSTDALNSASCHCRK